MSISDDAIDKKRRSWICYLRFEGDDIGGIMSPKIFLILCHIPTSN